MTWHGESYLFSQGKSLFRSMMGWPLVPMCLWNMLAHPLRHWKYKWDATCIHHFHTTSNHHVLHNTCHWKIPTPWRVDLHIQGRLNKGNDTTWEDEQNTDKLLSLLLDGHTTLLITASSPSSCPYPQQQHLLLSPLLARSSAPPPFLARSTAPTYLFLLYSSAGQVTAPPLLAIATGSNSYNIRTSCSILPSHLDCCILSMSWCKSSVISSSSSINFMCSLHCCWLQVLVHQY